MIVLTYLLIKNLLPKLLLHPHPSPDCCSVDNILANDANYFVILQQLHRADHIQRV